MVKIDQNSWMHFIIPKEDNDWKPSLVSKFQIYNVDHVYKNLVKDVLNSLNYSFLGGTHLVVKFSNGNVAYEPQKGLIQIVQFEIMK